MTRAEWDALTPEARNAVVAIDLLGWSAPPPELEVDDDFWYLGGDPEDEESFVWKGAARFTTDISAAWRVVEAMGNHPDGTVRTLRMVAYPYGRTYATFSWESDSERDWSEANGPHATPEAICVAALTATGAIR